MKEDCLEFEKVIVRKYIDVTISTIRAEDPDHLIFSNRFMMGDFGDWPRLIELYIGYDGIAINMYPANRAPGLSEPEKAVFRMAHEKTGMPIIVGEWSVPAIDSGLYDDPDLLDWSWPECVDTQQDRARQAALVTVDFYNLPFIVGAHWFTWQDIDDSRRRANRGLLTADGRRYAELLEGLARAHEAIAEAQR
jgi:agarase